MDTMNPYSEARRTRLFVVNIKQGGKVHCLVLTGTGRSYEKRARCGWRVGSAVAKALFCKRVVAGDLCRKCFRGTSLRPTSAEMADAIADP